MLRSPFTDDTSLYIIMFVVNIPIKSEEAIREFITFEQNVECSPINLFKNSQNYCIKITLNNKINKAKGIAVVGTSLEQVKDIIENID